MAAEGVGTVQSAGHPKLRSSIACTRCRTSKIRCDNKGINSVCEACHKSGKQCEYKFPPAPNPTNKRKASSASLDNGEVSQKKPRTRGTPGRSSLLAISKSASDQQAEDPLESPKLTGKLLLELFDIFQLHFAAELLFLHEPSFARFLDKFSHKAPRSQADEMLLLGLLTLTARFHKILSGHDSPLPISKHSDPWATSEYYAARLRELVVGEKGIDFAKPTLPRIQALLMLTLHEWGMCHGEQALIYHSIAVRMAHAKGLHILDSINEQSAVHSSPKDEAEHLEASSQRKKTLLARESRTGNFVIDRECERRTFWSCLILDRYLGSGRTRPKLISVDDVSTQLPASEDAFSQGQHAVCPTLGSAIGAIDNKQLLLKIEQDEKTQSAPNPNKQTVKEISANRQNKAQAGLASRVVKIIEIWGMIAKWSCAGGRRTESCPPWDPETKFHRLRSLLHQFWEELPSELEFSDKNVAAYISNGQATSYPFLHMIYFLCLIILHREYVPFLPMGLKKPVGPLDEPTFPPDKFDIPAGFWDESARDCFQSAHQIVEVAKKLKEATLLPETPIIGYALYTAAFTSSYCIHFPWMDQDSCLSSDRSPTYMDSALGFIDEMRPRLHMTVGWCKTIKFMDAYFERYRDNWERKQRAQSLKPEIRPAPGIGGGLSLYGIVETKLEFGPINEVDTASDNASSCAQLTTKAQTVASDDVRSETSIVVEEQASKSPRLPTPHEPPLMSLENLGMTNYKIPDTPIEQQQASPNVQLQTPQSLYHDQLNYSPVSTYHAHPTADTVPPTNQYVQTPSSLYVAAHRDPVTSSSFPETVDMSNAPPSILPARDSYGSSFTSNEPMTPAFAPQNMNAPLISDSPNETFMLWAQWPPHGWGEGLQCMIDGYQEGIGDVMGYNDMAMMSNPHG